MNVPDILKACPVVIEIPVAWGEMDAFQHLNNAVYFRYFESGRVAYFEKIAYMHHWKETGQGPILASTQCKFKYPVTYPDMIALGVKVSNVAQDRFIMEYEAFSRAGQRIAAQGQGVVVSYDYNKLQKTPLPEIIRQRILDLEAGVS